MPSKQRPTWAYDHLVPTVIPRIDLPSMPTDMLWALQHPHLEAPQIPNPSANHSTSLQLSNGIRAQPFEPFLLFLGLDPKQSTLSASGVHRVLYKSWVVLDEDSCQYWVYTLVCQSWYQSDDNRAPSLESQSNGPYSLLDGSWALLEAFASTTWSTMLQKQVQIVPNPEFLLPQGCHWHFRRRIQSHVEPTTLYKSTSVCWELRMSTIRLTVRDYQKQGRITPTLRPTRQQKEAWFAINYNVPVNRPRRNLDRRCFSLSPAESVSSADVGSSVELRPSNVTPPPISRPSDVLGTSFDQFLDQLQTAAAERPCRQDLAPLAAVSNRSVQHATPPPNVQSLQHLRSLERSPNHRWTPYEREVLHVLYRWYNAPFPVYTSIFNSVTGLSMRPSVVRAQITSTGSGSADTRRALYHVPFYDTAGIYASVRSLLEENARLLRCRLPRRQTEATSLLPLRSDYTTRRKSRLTAPVAPKASDYTSRWTPATSIALRAWNEDSFTIYSPTDGFIARMFRNNVQGVSTPWVPEEDPEKFYKHAAVHFHKDGIGNCADSPFLSLTDSLLQALKIAFDKPNASIAVIDLHHPSLRIPYKLHHAKHLIEDLRKRNLYQFHYKGTTEVVVFGSVSPDAILHTFPVQRLRHLASCNSITAWILQLWTFNKLEYVPEVARYMHCRNAPFTVQSAGVLGVLAREFGLGRSAATLLHIQDFVLMAVHGWVIRLSPREKSSTVYRLGKAFATALGSSYGYKDVTMAFVEGVVRGALFQFQASSHQE